MAYNGGFDQPPQVRPYGGPGGPGGQRPPPQRQYPPGPGGPQSYNEPPQQQQQYDQYPEGYGYGHDEYGNGYDQGYGEQYEDPNYNQRGYQPNQNYPPQQDFYGRGRGRGGGGAPISRGRGGPMRPLPADGGRGGPYPPRGGAMPPGAGRPFPPNRGGRPGPPERAGHSDPTDRRQPNGPISPAGFGDSPFPAMPGQQRRTNLDQEKQITAQMAGMDIGGKRPGPRKQGSQDTYRGRPSMDDYGGRGPGPMGPPGPARRPTQPYPPQEFADPRRGPPPGQDYGPPMGGYHDEGGYGPPGRSMTMPAREHMDMQHEPLPHRSESVPFNGRGMPPPRPNTAQAMRPPPQAQRGYPPNSGPNFGEPMYEHQPDAGHGAPQQLRPASFDDFYEYYDQQQGNGYPEQDPPSAVSDVPDFDAMPSTKPRNSLDQHMQAGTQEQTQRGPGRVPEMSDAPPMPMAMGAPMPGQYQQPPPAQPGYQGGPLNGHGGFAQSPPAGPPGPQGMGLPSGPAPYRPGVQPTPPHPQGTPLSNPDSLPSHPTPVRPGLMPNSLVSLGNKPPPVRNYGGVPTGPMPLAAPPQQMNGAPAPAPAAAEPAEAPVTVQELEHLRAVIKADSNDQASALRLAKRLVEAADVLVPNLPDPKARQRSRDRYLLDAQKILKKLANASNPEAMFFLADCCGRSLFSAEPDNKEAFTLYQSAAKLGHAAAAYRTAVCCEIGNEEGGGTRKDPLKAIQWYKRACLSPETLVRTTTGDKAVRDIQVGDMLLDNEDRPVQCLTAGPIQASSNMKTIKYQEYDSKKKVSFKCTSDHIMTLRATSVKPFLGAQSRVFWTTRCDRSEAVEDVQNIKWDQAMHELFEELSKDLQRRPTDGEARQYIHDLTESSVDEDRGEDSQMRDDPASFVMVELLGELRKQSVNVDDMGHGLRLSMLDRMEEYLETLMPEEEFIPDDDDLVIDLDAPRPMAFPALGPLVRETSSFRKTDSSWHPSSEAAPSSPLAQPESQGAQDSQGSKSTLADTVQLVPREDLMERFAIVREGLNKPRKYAKCKNENCQGTRTASARFKNDEQARTALELLSGVHYRVIDPYIVRELDLFTMTLEEYQATCESHEKTTANRKLKLYRAPSQFMASNVPSDPVPIDPYWLGFWLGDGTIRKPEVASSDPEIRVYCQAYVDRLNREKPAGSTGLYLAERQVHAAGEVRTYPDGKTYTNKVDVYQFCIAGTPGVENPITRELRNLGLYNNKSAGIPGRYIEADDEQTRLAVLAGLIESDGSLDHSTNVYCFSQTTYEHKKIVYDARELAISCGIQTSPVNEYYNLGKTEPTWRFWMSKGTEKFQNHLLIPRKRLDVSKDIKRRNHDLRTFDVEDAGEGEYRLIEVSGGLYQLADRTVVHNCTLGDTPAMYKVGMILLKGLLGQPRNPREAVSWLKRAAERADTENPHALHELGLLYESAQPNDAILRDEAYAFSLFKQAADLGYKFSQFRLGCAYEYGLMGCPIDPRLSIMFYSRAASQEEHQSELALSGWYLTGSEGVLAQSDTEAYLWARKAAMAGLAKGEYAMGYFTEVGIGVPASVDDAKRWYWRAAAQDFPKARERLEDLKRSGKNGPRARERISRSKIGKQQEGECSVM